MKINKTFKLTIVGIMSILANQQYAQQTLVNEDVIHSYSEDFSNIKGTSGGGLYNKGIFFDLNANFYQNEADYGGGLNNFSSRNTTVEVDGSTITLGTIYSLTGSFIENTATLGGGIYNYGGFINAYDVAFDENNSYTGGAVYNIKGEINLYDPTFTNNTAKSNGGALFISSVTQSYDTYTSIFVSKNAYYVGNQASDDKGGFAYLTSMQYYKNSKLNIDVSDGVTLTIGNGTSGYDSIASNNYLNSMFVKSSPGTLTINSSMEYFYGSFIVESGTINLNSQLGAGAISIDKSATLSISVLGNDTFSNSDLDYENNGTILLIADENLDACNYSIATSNICDWGDVIAYGGVQNDNIFEVSDAIILKDNGKTTVKDNGRVIIEENSEYIAQLAFNANSATINSITDATDDFSSQMTDVVSVAGYFFDIDMEIGDSVVVSFLIGDNMLTVDNFVIYEKNENGDWVESNSTSNESYDGQNFSFISSNPTSYSLVQVPEASTWGLILGLISISTLIIKRRK